MTLRRPCWSPLDASPVKAPPASSHSAPTKPALPRQAAALDRMRAEAPPSRLLPVLQANHMSVVLEMVNPQGTRKGLIELIETP